MVIDEHSLDWRALTVEQLHDALDAFADLLQPIADGRHVAFMNAAYEIECRRDLHFMEFLYVQHPDIPRDVRVRLARLIDRCAVVEPEENDLPQPMRIAGVEQPEPSWGVSHALARSAAGRAMSCLVVPHTFRHSGWITVECWAGQLEIHFMNDPSCAPTFWRRVFTQESTPEEVFFSLTSLAFPNLILVDGLGFHRFDGKYPEVLPWVVDLLGAVSDHFATAVATHRGDHNRVIAQFDALGLEISPESPSTKRNAKAWAERLVLHDNATYRCEWHGKRSWNHDRVHFTLPIPKLGNKVLIGIFVDHLST
ncbi:hypothetical protein [Nocardia sp. alder85J]|uniref:hypothetical protein n=1 Tax=Nocardia sp. alder85J TaxID=2862949 RepID=UPI001CD2C8F1|nr:hypothetical protein [Nocardia sp. alder85J]MCX4096124.1 hypothetical protein [Nocardia sp. alder85J]